MSWHSKPTTCLKFDNKCVLSMSASLNVIGVSALLPLWSDCTHTHPSSMGGRTHHVASNMVGTGAPSTKNFLGDVSCCNSRVAVTRLLRILCRGPMKHSAKESCASFAQKHETQTRADVCPNFSSLTQHSTQDNCTMFYPTSSCMSEHCSSAL